MRILFVNRPDALANPGGDTVQMRQTREALRTRGHEVVVSLDPAPDGAGFDIAHVFNIQNPDIQLAQVMALKRSKVPVVVSPIFWDHTEFDWAMRVIRGAFSGPKHQKQPLLEALARRDIQVNGLDCHTRLKGSDEYRQAQQAIVQEAALLLPNSNAEALNIQHSLGIASFGFRVVPNAVSPTFADADPRAFRDKYGKDPFILTAARWDDRKNLLLLLEALKDTDLPLVLIGTRPFPDYEALVRAHLRPNVTVLDALPQEELASAFAAARVHALPSWFETPGLSSLEAALAGTAVVVGNRAAELEYFGPQAHYCDPASIADIQRAIVRAWDGHPNDGDRRDALRCRIGTSYTWDKAAEETLAAYEEVRVTTKATKTRGSASVIIVTFRSASTIESCFSHLLPTLRSDDRVIVVDNASDDDTVQRIRSVGDERVRLIESKENLGFSRGVNRGLKHATGELVVLLNPDTEVTTGWLDGLATHLYRFGERVGAVGPISDHAAGKQHVAEWVPTWQSRSPEEIAAIVSLAGRGIKTMLLIGFCMVIPRAVLLEVGGLDPDLFLGNDDLDLSWRLTLSGYELTIATNVFVRHVGQASFATLAEGEAKRYERASTDALACKLEAHYGKGNVPTGKDLWGIEWFNPSWTTSGLTATRFLVPADTPWEPALRLYVDSFGPHDPVTLEIAGDDALGAEVAAWLETKGWDEDETPDIIVGPPLDPAGAVTLGREAPPESRFIAQEAPELLRQSIGYPAEPIGDVVTSIVMLTWNQIDCTQICLDSLFENTHEPFELIMVDNGSNDGTRDYLKTIARGRPNVRLIFNERNLGFAAGCNQGMAIARGEFILLLNNDTVLTEGWLTRMLRPMRQDPTIGAVGPKSNYVASRQLISPVPYEKLDGMHQFAKERAREHAGRGSYDLLAIGFALLLRTEAVKKIGSLDTGFGPGNFEDDDYCVRLLLAGYRIWVAEDVFIHHFGSVTFKGQNFQYNDLVMGNLDLFVNKWQVERGPEGSRPNVMDLLNAWVPRLKNEDIWIALPEKRDIPLVAEPFPIEGLKTANLLLWPDWESADWEPLVAAYASLFDGQTPVTLVAVTPTSAALERLSALLGAGGKGDDSPDVLVVEEAADLGQLVATTNGVALTGGALDPALAQVADLLGRPAVRTPDLETWAHQALTSKLPT